MIPGRRLFEQPFGVAALTALAIMVLATLRQLDQSIAQSGLWVFLGLTLTTGFFHGALDIVLLQREFAGARRRTIAVVLYAGLALLVALICAQSGWLLILMLLVMSVWHFGEPYGRWGNSAPGRHAWVQRIIAGGAPVMLPALLSPDALQAVMPAAVALDAPLAFSIWQMLAWGWVGVCGVALAVFRRRLFSKPFLSELALVFSFNLLLSPLMAFSVYFGVLHAGTHIFRVGKKYRQPAAFAQKKSFARTAVQPTALAVTVTCLATFLLLLVLAWSLQNAPDAAGRHRSVLNMVVIALTAVTLPHLILVARHSRWLAAASRMPKMPLLAAPKGRPGTSRER